MRNEIWEPFRNPKEFKYKSTVKVMNFEQKIDENFKAKLSDNLSFCLSRKISEIDEKNFIKNYNILSPKFEITNEQSTLIDKKINENISFFAERIGSDYKKFKEPYTKKIERQNQNIDIRMGDINFSLYSEHQNKIIKNIYSKNTIEKIDDFTRKFKEKKENINLSSLDLIFKPNLPTQYVLSTKGSIIDMDAFFKYFLNPTPNPMFYRELEGGFIKNYGITVVIDTSLSCLNYFTYEHYLDTIRILLSIFSFSELPYFDLVVTGFPNPIVICSEMSTSNALNEKSSLWANLYSSLIPIQESDLASAIKVAFDLNNIRRSESTNFIFVVTDGLFSIIEQKVIFEKVKMCENRGINVFGIGVGISPKGLENIFTNIIFAQNPYQLINAIAGFFGEMNCPCKDMPNTEIISNIYNYRPSSETLTNLKEKPVFYKLKEYLSKILFIPESIPMYNPEDEIDLDPSLAHEENIILKPTYTKDCLKGQKLLIIMLWSHEMDSNESDSIDEKYIFEPYNGAKSCIKEQLAYYGIEIKVVKNYIDGIKELTTEDENLKGKCKYFAAMVMNGPNFKVLPGQKNEVEESRYVLQFLEALKMFWENGGGVLLFNENKPFFFQTNLFLSMIEFPGKYNKVRFKIDGEHKGGNQMNGNNEGDLSEKGTFTRKRAVIDSFQRSIIGHGLMLIDEGTTLSYVDYDLEKIKPFIAFSRDNEGGINSLYYIGTEGRGDIIIDNSYTKFLSDLKNSCTAKLIQNMIAWIARVDYHYMKGTNPQLYRPRLVEYKFDPNKKCDEKLFGKLKNREEIILEYKTLFAIDYSGSIKNKKNYHNYLKNNILPKYYKKERGDAIYLWESAYNKIDYEKMMEIISNMSGSGGTSSSKIAEILLLESNNNFDHLVIVTDGEVSLNEINKSDDIMKKNRNNIKLKYVSTFIIDTYGKCNLSVGAPYCRDVPNTTIYVDKDLKEVKQPSLFKEDLDEWKKLGKEGYSQKEFLDNYSKILNAVKAKTLGSSSKETLRTLLNFKKKVLDEEKSLPIFIDKINGLISFAQEGNMDFSLKVT